MILLLIGFFLCCVYVILVSLANFCFYSIKKNLFWREWISWKMTRRGTDPDLQFRKFTFWSCRTNLILVCCLKRQTLGYGVWIDQTSDVFQLSASRDRCKAINNAQNPKILAIKMSPNFNSHGFGFLNPAAFSQVIKCMNLWQTWHLDFCL